MRVSICLGAILIPEYVYLDSILAILNSRNIFRKTFLFRNIPNERALKLLFLAVLQVTIIRVWARDFYTVAPLSATIHRNFELVI